MQIRWFALLSLVTKLFAIKNEIFITRDYFVYKNVKSIVAFLCSDSTSDNFHLTKILNQEGISVAILYPELNFSLETIVTPKYLLFGIILDLQCGNDSYSKFILTESSKIQGYNESYNWLLFGKSLNESIQMLDDETFSVGTDLVIASRTNSSHDYEYQLHDVYNPCKIRDGKLNITKFGYWNNETGLTVTLVEEKYQRRANFHGMKLKVISVTQYRPHSVIIEDYLQDYGTRELDTMSKFTYAILLHIGDVFNFTMEIVETSFWDQISSSGRHFGMVGMLNRNEADLGATPAIMTIQRTGLAQLIGPVWPFRTCFMFRSITTRVNDEFIRPFAPESWITIAITVVICAITLSLTLKIEFVKEKLNTWNEAALVTMGIMCQQGSMFTPENLSSRIVIMNLLIFSLMIYNYYSASVVSAQLNLPLDKMNDSLHQLTKSQLKVGAEPITYTNYALTAGINDWEVKEFYQKRWRPFSEESLYLPLEEGFEKVAKGGFAYHTDPNSGYPYVERLFTDQMICELTEVHLFKPQKMAIWGRHKSPFTKITKIGLTKLYSSGIVTRLTKRWESRKPICFREAFTVQSVSMLTTAPAFIILGVGIFLSFLICFIENFIANKSSFLFIHKIK